MNTLHYEPFERVPQFHTDKRTTASFRRLINAIGRSGAPSAATDEYFDFWNDVLAQRNGLSSRGEQKRDNTPLDRKLAVPHRIQGDIVISGTLSVLDEIGNFPDNSHTPRAVASWEAELYEGPQDEKRVSTVLYADYEISAAPTDSEWAGGIGVSIELHTIPHQGTPRPLPPAIMEVWDEMGLGGLGDCPEEGPLPTTYFDGSAKQLEALTRFALKQWPEESVIDHSHKKTSEE